MRFSTQIRIAAEQVPLYASRYSHPLEPTVEALVADVRTRGFLTKSDLTVVGEWKSPRVRSRIAKNAEEEVRETTRLALETRSVRLSVHVLQALSGTGMPVASTILHWFHPDPYPILDFRALWTLGVEMPSLYNLDFWEGYVMATRELAGTWGVDMRTLDRALWQYSSEHQEPNSG